MIQLQNDSTECDCGIEQRTLCCPGRANVEVVEYSSQVWAGGLGGFQEPMQKHHFSINMTCATIRLAEIEGRRAPQLRFDL